MRMEKVSNPLMTRYGFLQVQHAALQFASPLATYRGLVACTHAASGLLVGNQTPASDSHCR